MGDLHLLFFASFLAHTAVGQKRQINGIRDESAGHQLRSNWCGTAIGAAGYTTSANAMIGRRDNFKRSIGELKRQLADAKAALESSRCVGKDQQRSSGVQPFPTSTKEICS